MSYFNYDSENNTVKINISEYQYDKDLFNLEEELPDFINEINRLYNLCDDDRITCDTDANTEFYTREAIQNIPDTKLLQLKWRLDSQYVSDDEKVKIKHQIEILEEVVEEINRLLY